jgi:ribosomal-protein-alanine N-acetyltransferase
MVLSISPRTAFPPGGIAGRKVRLARFCVTDIAERYVGWLNNPTVVRFSNQRFRHHDESTCRTYLDTFEGTDNLFLSIVRASDGQAIGTLTAYVSKPHETADVGILIGDTAVWGQGFGLDAWQTISNWLLEECKIRKITGGTLSCNLGMRTVFERSGMHLEARRRAQELVDGRAEDVLYYARFRSE